VWRAADTVISGHGTKNIISKFVGPHTIRNSGLVEANGVLSTTERLRVGEVRATVTAPNGVGMWGLNNGSTGHAVGVRGESGSTIGFGVEGVSFSPTGTGIGILGEAASSDAFAGVFNNVSASGYPTGAFGYVTSPDGGIGILGRAWSNTGTGVGIRGEAFTPNGVAGAFDNTAGGNILVGMVSGVNRFRVDGTGFVFADGGYQTGGADFAESIGVRGVRALYEPGDLLVIDPTGNRRLTLAQHPYSTLVAGVYSTKPGVLASVHQMDDPSIALDPAIHNILRFSLKSAASRPARAASPLRLVECEN